MNKSIWKPLFLLLLLSGCIDRKHQLSGVGSIVNVAPSATTLRLGETKDFIVTVSDGHGVVAEPEVSWSVSPAELGAVSPLSGSRVTFTPGSLLGAGGTVTATSLGASFSAQVFVQSSVGETAKSYAFYSESLPAGFRFDAPNPPNVDGGTLLAFNGGGGGILLSDATQIGFLTEGTKALKAGVTSPSSPSVGWWAGYSFQFGMPSPGQTNDLSRFSGGWVKFDLRAPGGQEVFLKLESAAGSPELALSSQGILFDDQFHSYSIPLSSFSGLNLATFRGVTYSAKFPALGNFDFYLDNLRLEKP